MCSWRLMFGIYCPGCGTTRAYKALMDGNFVDAFLYNPFLFMVTISVVIYIIVTFSKGRVNESLLLSLFKSPKTAWATMVIFIGVWIFRNIFPLGLVRYKEYHDTCVVWWWICFKK